MGTRVPAGEEPGPSVQARKAKATGVGGGWGGGQGVVRSLGRWTVPSRRGRKPGSSGRKNGGMGSKSKDKKLSGTDSEQEVSEAPSPLPYRVVWRRQSCIRPCWLDTWFHPHLLSFVNWGYKGQATEVSVLSLPLPGV